MELNRRHAEFRDLGATLVAVSADEPGPTQGFATREELRFPLACDPEGATIRAWGTTEAGRTRSVPASFVVDTGGRVRYRHVGESIGDRSSADALLSAVARIARGTGQ